MNELNIHMLSKGMPDEFIRTTIPTSSIYRAVEEFFDEYFRGAVIMDGDRYTPGYIEISSDGLAFFFKLLFKAAFGESTVKINVKSENFIYEINAEWKKRRIISEKEIFELKNAARLAGFEVAFDDGDEFYRVNLSVKLKITKAITIYAKSLETLRTALTRVFFLI